jgi:hypothetical protein
VPLYDIEEFYQPGEPRDLLVRSCRLGAELASKFSSKNSSSSSQENSAEHALVLMRRHGFTTHGRDIKEAVYRAIFTTKNAKVQTSSILLRNSFDVADIGVTNQPWSAVCPFEPLTSLQAEDSAVTAFGARDRPWSLWVEEVKAQSLYSIKD